jgi:hypothetical protein
MRAAVRIENRRGGAATKLSLPPLLLVAALAAVPGCRRDEVTHYRVAKAAPAKPAMATPAAMPAGSGAMAGDVPPPPAVEGGSALRWTLPKGWSEAVGGGGMRYATLKAPVPGKLDVSVTVLPGPAGGELANVNRWRNQIGLGPLDEAGLAAARRMVKTPAGPVAVYEFQSDGQARARVLAGLTVKDGNTWFVKMTGEDAAVTAAKPAFLTLVESLRFDAAR